MNIIKTNLILKIIIFIVLLFLFIQLLLVILYFILPVFALDKNFLNFAWKQSFSKFYVINRDILLSWIFVP